MRLDSRMNDVIETKDQDLFWKVLKKVSSLAKDPSKDNFKVINFWWIIREAVPVLSNNVPSSVLVQGR